MKCKRATVRNGPRAGVVLALSATILLTGGTPAPPLPALNEKVVAFARERLGKCVGDGSCSTLAIAALKAAGARSYPDVAPGGDLSWGQPIESFREALPGDILQFHNAVFQGKKTISKRRWITWHHEYPHHTAIVARVSEGGKAVAVLHQNVTMTGKEGIDAKNVLETTLRMDSLQDGGWVRIYRPVTAPGRATADGGESPP